ncbi:MAG: hypothetical protein Q9183_005563, partial [Haloplaca sp. 2 TL-2023]
PKSTHEVRITSQSHNLRGQRKASSLPNFFPDTRYFGDYAIVNCNENAATIENLLSFILTATLSAAQDSETTPLSPAYHAFFKDPEESILVSNILVNIAAGKPIHRPSEINDGGPVLVCVNARNELKGRLPNGDYYDAFD